MSRRDDIRAFALRPWAEIERTKREGQADAYRRHGSSWTWRIAQGLRTWMRAARPDWPTAGERAADLDHHVELKRLLDLAGHAIARR